MQPFGVAGERSTTEAVDDEGTPWSGIDGDRVISFSDNVFAFAATLLVLSIDVPSSGSGLGDALLEEWPNLFAYGLSFAILGNFWIDHHKLYGRLRSVDGKSLWISLLYLAMIALVPFSCELIGEHGDTSVGVSVYAVNIVAVTLAFAAICRHAVATGEISGGPEGVRVIEATAFAGIVLAVIFAASAVLAIFVSPEVATWSYFSIFLILPGSMRIWRRRRGYEDDPGRLSRRAPR
ncbi:DUF1211 domain-containing protein [Thermoleophilia bacterium SCSIO 60948]|nr:DUF1211 domain-containing protein [Thermoleophilia bacterium SCSIO 60948]